MKTKIDEFNLFKKVFAKTLNKYLICKKWKLSEKEEERNEKGSIKNTNQMI